MINRANFFHFFVLLLQTKWFKNGKELDSEFYQLHGDRYTENKKEQSLTIKELRNEDIVSISAMKKMSIFKDAFLLFKKPELIFIFK